MAADSDAWDKIGGNDSDSGEDDDDSWFYASMKRYKNLHMFDLQHSTRVIEWIDQKSICVAGFDKAGKNELWELAVPEKLLPSSVDEGLCKDRDFKLQGGGFTGKPVWDLKHVKNTAKIVTSEMGENSVHVYHLGRDSSDVINHVIEIKNPYGDRNEHACFDLDQNCVVFGKYLHDICVADITSGQVCERASGSSDDSILSHLQVVASKVVAVCVQSSGQTHILDTRDKIQVVQSSSGNSSTSESSSWTLGVGTVAGSVSMSDGHGDASTTLLGCLSTTGHFLLTDLRKIKEPLSEVVLPHQTEKDEEGFLRVQFAPHNPGLISVSGFGGNVCIYDSTPWQGRVPFVSPLFVHDGHAAGKRESDQALTAVTTHGWHPLMPNIILSAGTDKSLHAWEWQVELE